MDDVTNIANDENRITYSNDITRLVDDVTSIADDITSSADDITSIMDDVTRNTYNSRTTKLDNVTNNADVETSFIYLLADTNIQNTTIFTSILKYKSIKVFEKENKA